MIACMIKILTYSIILQGFNTVARGENGIPRNCRNRSNQCCHILITYHTRRHET